MRWSPPTERALIAVEEALRGPLADAGLHLAYWRSDVYLVETDNPVLWERVIISRYANTQQILDAIIAARKILTPYLLPPLRSHA